MRRTRNSADGLLKFPIRAEVPDDGEVLAYEKASSSYLPKSLTALGIDWSGVTGTPTTLAGYGITDAQPLDSDLTAVAGLSTNGLLTRTGSGSAAARTLTGTAGQVTVTNGDGVAGNPTISLPSTITQATTFSAGLTASTITSQGAISPSNTTVTWTAGAGSPEGFVTAPVGSLYSRTDGGAGTCLYIKESGAGNTGWKAVSLDALASATWQ